MTACRNRFRPRLECLEGRDTPGVLNISYSAVSHTLTIAGDPNDNSVTVHGDAADPETFSLTSATDSFIGLPGPYTGVQNIVISLLDGNDAVTFANAPAIHLTGNLTVKGGGGANTVTALDLTVAKNVSITNGTSVGGIDTNTLTNLNVGGSVTIKDGDGDTQTSITRNAAGLSTIGKNLTVINGTGLDFNKLADTDVGGNVTFANGHGRGGQAGWTAIYNAQNTAYRSVIGGNVSVSYLDGSSVSSDGIWDTEVRGNAKFSNGTGALQTSFDGFSVAAPALIRGSLTITGSGDNSVYIGRSIQGAGLIVGGNVSVTTGAGNDGLFFNKLQVTGATKLLLGDGNNIVAVDDSDFSGVFTLVTGIGIDQVKLDTATSTGSPTVFERPVSMRLGAGNDSVTVAGTNDAGQEVIVLSSFVIHHGTGTDTPNFNPSHELFPFGTSIDWIS